MLCVCKDKKRKYQSLGISVSAAHWDFKKNQLKEDCPDYVRIQLVIDTEIGKTYDTAKPRRILQGLTRDRVPKSSVFFIATCSFIQTYNIDR